MRDSFHTAYSPRCSKILVSHRERTSGRYHQVPSVKAWSQRLGGVLSLHAWTSHTCLCRDSAPRIQGLVVRPSAATSSNYFSRAGVAVGNQRAYRCATHTCCPSDVVNTLNTPTLRMTSSSHATTDNLIRLYTDYGLGSQFKDEFGKAADYQGMHHLCVGFATKLANDVVAEIRNTGVQRRIACLLRRPEEPCWVAAHLNALAWAIGRCPHLGVDTRAWCYQFQPNSLASEALGLLELSALQVVDQPKKKSAKRPRADVDNQQIHTSALRLAKILMAFNRTERSFLLNAELVSPTTRFKSSIPAMLEVQGLLQRDWEALSDIVTRSTLRSQKPTHHDVVVVPSDVLAKAESIARKLHEDSECLLVAACKELLALVPPGAVHTRMTCINDAIAEFAADLRPVLPHVNTLIANCIPVAVSSLQCMHLTAIVGLISAGKSSLLRELTGHALFPHAATACTAIPTIVIRDERCPEPQLSIPCAKYLNLIMVQIRALDKLMCERFHQINNGAEVVACHPIRNLVRALPTTPFSRSCNRASAIHQALNHLNYVIRALQDYANQPALLAESILAPDTVRGWLGKLSWQALPVIRVAFKSIASSTTSTVVGFVDTPGACEVSSVGRRLTSEVLHFCSRVSLRGLLHSSSHPPFLLQVMIVATPETIQSESTHSLLRVLSETGTTSSSVQTKRKVTVVVNKIDEWEVTKQVWDKGKIARAKLQQEIILATKDFEQDMRTKWALHLPARAGSTNPLDSVVYVSAHFAKRADTLRKIHANTDGALHTLRHGNDKQEQEEIRGAIKLVYGEVWEPSEVRAGSAKLHKTLESMILRANMHPLVELIGQQSELHKEVCMRESLHAANEVLHRVSSLLEERRSLTRVLFPDKLKALKDWEAKMKAALQKAATAVENIHKQAVSKVNAQVERLIREKLCAEKLHQHLDEQSQEWWGNRALSIHFDTPNEASSAQLHFFMEALRVLNKRVAEVAEEANEVIEQFVRYVTDASTRTHQSELDKILKEAPESRAIRGAIGSIHCQCIAVADIQFRSLVRLAPRAPMIVQTVQPSGFLRWVYEWITGNSTYAISRSTVKIGSDTIIGVADRAINHVLSAPLREHAQTLVGKYSDGVRSALGKINTEFDAEIASWKSTAEKAAGQEAATRIEKYTHMIVNIKDVCSAAGSLSFASGAGSAHSQL